MMRQRWLAVGFATGIVAVMLMPERLSAFALDGASWREPEVVMHLQLGSSGGTLIDGATSWGQSAEGALANWNSVMGRLEFRVVRDSTADIAYGNGINNVYFSSTVEGQGFQGAVAVTLLRTSGRRLTETDVVFNTALDFNAYRGPLRSAAAGGTLYDFRRVAIHEFGHVLGLDHPDQFGQNQKAIMNSRVSDIDDLRADDIRGAQALYGAVAGTGQEARLAKVRRPKDRQVRTTRRVLTVRGVASAAAGADVIFARSNRSGRDEYVARGLSNWLLQVPLQRGPNRIRIFVETDTGEVQRLRSLVVRRVER